MMAGSRLVFSDEHDALRQSVRGFLATRCAESDVRRLMDTSAGYSARVWLELTRDLGLAGLCVPEEWGGTGAGQRKLTVVFEELGRVLACTPLFATVALAVMPLLCSEDEAAQRRYLPGICQGSLTATLAHLESSGSWAIDEVALAASPHRGRWSPSGDTTYVVDGATAGLVLVTARTPNGVGLFAVSTPADGLTADPVELIDRTRSTPT